MPLDIASTGKFLASELAVYDDQYYDVPEDELWGASGQNIPSTGDLPFGAEEINSYRRQFIGEASISDGRAYDIPLVDFGVSGTKAKAVLVLAGAEWSVADLHREELAARNAIGSPRVNVTESKMEAVNVAINRRIHRLVYAGQPEIDFDGMFNASDIQAFDATADGNLYGDTTPLTPAELTDWMQGRIAAFKIDSRLPYASIIAYVDDSLYTALCKPLSDNTGDTPFMRLTSSERGRFLGDVRPLTELNPTTLQDIGIISSPTTRGRMLLGAWDDPRSVRRHFQAIDRTDPFMKDSGFHWGVTGWAATSELAVKVPERFEYIDFAHS